MEKRRYLQLKLLSYSVIAYMMLAFGWWSVLLFTKNRDAFQAKKEYLILYKVAKGEITDAAQIEQFPEYQELKKHYRNQEYMITGEVLVFVCILVIGLWLINNGYNKEINAAVQRRNFLLSITHELKSPIASIRLVLDTLVKRELKPEIKHKLLDNGLVETERLHQLVNNLLLSARLEAAYQPNREMVDLPLLAEDLLEMLHAKHPNLQVELDLEEDIPFLLGDRIGMTSVLLNLFENAIKYSAGDPYLNIKMSQVKQQICLEIADHGIGISDKEKKKVFEKFYRIGNEDTRKTKGTGLGLYIVKQIIEAHQGTIRLADNEPRGTVFKITLPAHPQSVDKQPQLANDLT